MDKVYDSYMKRRHLDLAIGGKKPKWFRQNRPDGSKFEIKQTEDFKFTVKSEKGSEHYVVDMGIGACTCPIGHTGAVCKHQVACSHKYLVMMPQVFQNTPQNRQWLARVCYGDEKLVPSIDFFSTLEDGVNDIHNALDGTSSGSSHAASSKPSIIQEKQDTGNSGESSRPRCDFSEVQQPEQNMNFQGVSELENSDDDFVVMEGKKKKYVNFAEEISDDDDFMMTKPLQEQNSIGTSDTIHLLNKLIEKYGNSETDKVLGKIEKRLVTVKTPNMLNSALHSLLSGLPHGTTRLGAGRGKIPCQPSSIARREVGLPRGAAPLSKGRKRKSSATGRPTKHIRNLSFNISQNQPNGKRH